MKHQITEQANGLFSVYTDSGEQSMADEDLLAFDKSYEAAQEFVTAIESVQ